MASPKRSRGEGARVALLDLNGDKAQEAAKAIGGGAFSVACDVAKADSVDAAVKQVLAAFGRLDIVVNNAGTTHRNKPMVEVTEEEFDRVFAGERQVDLPDGQGDRAAFQGPWRRGDPEYRLDGRAAAAAGADLVQMARRARPICCRSPWRSSSRRTRSASTPIAPVAGETPLLATFMGEDTPEKRAQFKSVIPWGRFSTPQDIANAALFLCSAESEMVTGTVLAVDGGRCV